MNLSVILKIALRLIIFTIFFFVFNYFVFASTCTKSTDTITRAWKTSSDVDNNSSDAVNGANNLMSDNNHPANKICYSYDVNNYINWYLPSSGELDTLYNRRSMVNNFALNNYWSSTQDLTASYAKIKNFSTGLNSATNKINSNYIRCIRKFDCTPATCGTPNKTCGVWPDGCGNIIDCKIGTGFANCGDMIYYCGEYYPTIKIGTQCWFAKNLNVGVLNNLPTNNGIIEKSCYNSDTSICATDGALYNWNEAMQYVTTEGAQGICPNGWHIPTNTEWHVLEMVYANPANETNCPASRSSVGCAPAGTALIIGGSSGFNVIFAGLFESMQYNGSRERGVATTIFSSNIHPNNLDHYLRRFRSDSYASYVTAEYNQFSNSVRCLKN